MPNTYGCLLCKVLERFSTIIIEHIFGKYIPSRQMHMKGIRPGTDKRHILSCTAGLFLAKIINLLSQQTACYHCGDVCPSAAITYGDKIFCCNGCLQVYQLLEENGLCNYYSFDQMPGIKVKGKFLSEKYGYLDDLSVQEKLLQFKSDDSCNVTFHLPQIHCASCIYLLEHLHRIDAGITASRTDFQQKKIFISFNPNIISLRKVVEILAFVGYEPPLNLNDISSGQKKSTDPLSHKKIRNLGIAGFGFANIMMLSFPDYFSGGAIDAELKHTFTWLCFVLSIPVLLTGGRTFFIAAYKSLRQGIVSIDAPIALATAVTFGRSYYEIISGTGTGYLDSGTGIIFLMLAGRWFQDKTYAALSFDRDHRSYFPLGATIIKNGAEQNVPATKLRPGDRLVIRNEEMVPADAVLIEGDCRMDYGFISGEQTAVPKKPGELVYAGGKQMGGTIGLVVKKPTSQSYITQLWNGPSATKNGSVETFIHPWSRYFTLALFSVAIAAAIYWWVNDTAMILPAVTAVLIVACPCSLLLSATFTYGNMQRIFGRKKFYLKNTGIIDSLAMVDTIVFDKTGTLTAPSAGGLFYEGEPLTLNEQRIVKTLTGYSTHPLSKRITGELDVEKIPASPEHFFERTGKGISARMASQDVMIGSAEMVGVSGKQRLAGGSTVYVKFDDHIRGCFHIGNYYREGISQLAKELLAAGYDLHVLSGDNDREREALKKLFHHKVAIRFNQSPSDKINYIRQLQAKGKKVLMAGDGLNDAGALLAANTGIAVNNDSALFTPACDGILSGDQLPRLHKFLRYAAFGKKAIVASFVLSILYNICGLSFAVAGRLSPLVAAILMPLSSVSIVLFVTITTRIAARRLLS